jgi:hypothetical protein
MLITRESQEWAEAMRVMIKTMAEISICNRGNDQANIEVRRALDSIAAILAASFVLLMASASPALGQQIGHKQTTSSGHIVTVYSISWPTPVSSVSADVEVCAGPKAPAESFAFPSFFQVHFADGGAIGSYGSKKQPTLERTPLKPGQCVRGWLDFAVTSGQKPTVVRYHEMSADHKVIEWPVK